MPKENEVLKLNYEVNAYVDKNGEMKEALNYYVEHPVLKIKIQLKPNDYTARELLNSMVDGGLIEKGE